MNELALYAGAGGGILGGHLLSWRCVCAVEKEPYCREVLLRRQRDGVLPVFPIWDDIHTFDGRAWRGTVDIVTAGFPCQPFSVAGRRKGKDDDRNLWPETIRVVREVGAPRVFLENVPGLLASDYFGQILGDLAEAGYDAEWGVVSAAEVGANHRRERLWIVADADTDGCHAASKNQEGAKGDAFSPARPLCQSGLWPKGGTNVANPSGVRREQGKSVHGQGTVADVDGSSEEMADTSATRLQGDFGTLPKGDGAGFTDSSRRGRTGYWAIEPDVGRVANGVAAELDGTCGYAKGIDA